MGLVEYPLSAWIVVDDRMGSLVGTLWTVLRWIVAWAGDREDCERHHARIIQFHRGQLQDVTGATRLGEIELVRP